MRTRHQIEAFRGLVTAVARGEETPLLDWIGEQDDPRLWVDSLYSEWERIAILADKLADKMFGDTYWTNTEVFDEDVIIRERLLSQASALRRTWKEAEALFPAPAEEIPF